MRFAIFTALVVALSAAMLGVMARSDPGIVEPLPYSLPVIVVVLGLSILTSVRTQLVRQKASWDSYELTMGPSLLVRRVAGLPVLEVLRTEVTRIEHAKGGGITVSTADR